MEETIETKVDAKEVWQAWERAQRANGELGIQAGQKGKNQFRYQILNVKKGESFSILWKTFFTRLVFTHSVAPISGGAKISYKVQFKGLFALPVKWLLGAKIQKNLNYVLKAMVKELEAVQNRRV
jgi:hypothetical protein